MFIDIDMDIDIDIDIDIGARRDPHDRARPLRAFRQLPAQEGGQRGGRARPALPALDRHLALCRRDRRASCNSYNS